MRRVNVPLLALVLTRPWTAVASARELQVRPERPRAYGGSVVAVSVRAGPGAQGGGRRVRWATWIAGAVIERGEAPVAEDGSATFAVRAPKVRREADMEVRVEKSRVGEVLVAAGGSCTVRVFPPYDGARLKKLFRSAQVGVAEAADEVSSRLARFGCRYDEIGGRLGLGFFEGDVIVASGRWWASDGDGLAGLLRGHLSRGARAVVIEGVGGGPHLEAARLPGGAYRVEHVDRLHPFLGDVDLARGWTHPAPFSVTGRAGFRRVAVEPETDHAVVAEVFPPEGGALLAVSLPVLSSFERDPAAAILFERCVEWAIRARVPRWKKVAFRFAGADGTRERLARLGVRGREELPADGGGVLLIAPAALADELTDELTDDTHEWIRAGGTAVLLVPGAPARPPARIARASATRGLSVGLARRLCVAGVEDDSREDDSREDDSRDDDSWAEVPLEGKRRALVEGLLDRIDLGRGRAYVLRIGPHEGELTRPWREFLVQVFTNLGVRCGEVGGDE